MKQNILLLIGILFFLTPRAQMINTLHNVEIALVTDTAHKQVSKTVFETKNIKYYLVEAPQRIYLVDSLGQLLFPVSEWRIVTIDSIRVLTAMNWDLPITSITEILEKGKASQLPPQVAVSRENGRIISGNFPNFKIAFDYVTPFFKIKDGWVVRILEKKTEVSSGVYVAGLIIGGIIAMFCGFLFGYPISSAILFLLKGVSFSKRELVFDSLSIAFGGLFSWSLFMLSLRAGTGVSGVESYQYNYLTAMTLPFVVIIVVTCAVRLLNLKTEPNGE